MSASAVLSVAVQTEDFALEEKRGGASGVWLREAEPHA